MHAVYDLGRGGFSHLDLTDGHGAEAIDRGAPVVGEIRIGDRNYATAPSLHRFRRDSAGQDDFIVRVRWRGFNLSRADGSGFDLIEHLGTLARVRSILSVNGYVNAIPGFADSPSVINGASDLLVAVFGESGRHVRAAIGVSGLPRNALVELQMTVEI